MSPKLFDAEALQAFNTYGLLITLAFATAFLYIHWRVRQIGVVPDRMLPAYILAFVGGIGGARLLHAVMVTPGEFFSNPLSLFSTGGFAIYGGLGGGVVAVLAYLIQQRLPVLKLADIIWPGVLVAMGIGRIGCFFAGCCHGIPVEGFEGAPSIGFPDGDVLLSSAFPFVAHEYHEHGQSVSRLKEIALYPTQTWLAMVGLGIGGLLMWAWSRRRFDGQLLALGLMLEPPFRILAEGFRSDSRGYVVSWPIEDASSVWLPGMAQAGTSLESAMMGITTSQAGGVMFIIAGAIIYVVQRNAGVAEETPIPSEEDDDLLLAGLDLD